VQQSVALLGGLDGLVNCGAITNSGGRNLDQLEIDTWDQVMTVNVRGSWLMSRAALPALRAARAQGGGRIVNIASDTALWGAPRLMAYVASKGALITLTRTLAIGLGVKGITVNAVSPGFIDTPMARRAIDASLFPIDYRDILASYPIPRLGTAQDIAAAVNFLSSEEAGYITGQSLNVNGGCLTS
jgi:NAD(P)-dependent dehydrogenase (short-subunit alcohol dehydrogenase family)